MNDNWPAATQAEVQHVIKLIATTWSGTVQDMDPGLLVRHYNLLAADLSRFPHDILLETVANLQRTLLDRHPAIAEFYQPSLHKLRQRYGAHLTFK